MQQSKSRVSVSQPDKAGGPPWASRVGDERELEWLEFVPRSGEKCKGVSLSPQDPTGNFRSAPANGVGKCSIFQAGEKLTVAWLCVRGRLAAVNGCGTEPQSATGAGLHVQKPVVRVERRSQKVLVASKPRAVVRKARCAQKRGPTARIRTATHVGSVHCVMTACCH